MLFQYAPNPRDVSLELFTQPVHEPRGICPLRLRYVLRYCITWIEKHVDVQDYDDEDPFREPIRTSHKRFSPLSEPMDANPWAEPSVICLRFCLSKVSECF
jgi:hypothetical protein